MSIHGTCMFMFMSRVPENRFWIGPKKDRRTKLRRDGRAPGRSGSDEVRQTKMNFFAKNYHNRTLIKRDHLSSTLNSGNINHFANI